MGRPIKSDPKTKVKGISRQPSRGSINSGTAQGRVLQFDIESWSQFVDTIQSWRGFRNWCFRGHGDARWLLKSSLSRHIEVSKVVDEAWVRQESRIRRIFERKSHLFLIDPPANDEVEWLALMQHHGAPTRLLDFTWSPYVAAFFALERATSDAAIWAVNLPLLWDTQRKNPIGRVRVTHADPRDAANFNKYYLPNKHAFVWQGDPFRMPQRVVAQSGTFLISSHLGMTVEEIVAGYPGSGELLIKFVLNTSKLRSEAMASLYSMNITQATLFPGLDGLARSMAYEFEYSWLIDVTTNTVADSFRNPRLPKELFDKRSKGVAV
jgi:hypothetical protein